MRKAFLIGRTLSPHVRHLSLEKISELSWRQLAENNVLYIGAEQVILKQLRTLPVPKDFTYEYEGIVNHSPRAGEPRLFDDPPGVKAQDASEDGTAFALVSYMPGPAGQGRIATFTSNAAPAHLGAIQLFITPSGAKDLVTRLKARNDHFPGSDIVLLDELGSTGSRQVFAASRNKREPADSAGTPRLFMKGPLIGGFVPRSALLPDGSPHPHAGTGFGVGQVQWFPYPRTDLAGGTRSGAT